MSAVMTLLSANEAQRLTQRIKLTASGVRDGLYKLRNLIDEAKGSNAWQILGFASWTAYLVDTLGDEPMRVSREERMELVGYLAGEGLSTRAIAPIVGVHHDTVASDIKATRGVGNPTPAQTGGGAHLPDEAVASPVEPPAPRLATVDLNTGEVMDEPTRTVTGLDGKTYTQKPPVDRRSSILDDARNAGWQLRKAVERIERIRGDDRFTKNKAEIVAALQPHLDFAAEVLADL